MTVCRILGQDRTVTAVVLLLNEADISDMVTDAQCDEILLRSKLVARGKRWELIGAADTLSRANLPSWAAQAEAHIQRALASPVV
jgi:hypothetical protein